MIEFSKDAEIYVVGEMVQDTIGGEAPMHQTSTMGVENMEVWLRIDGGEDVEITKALSPNILERLETEFIEHYERNRE